MARLRRRCVLDAESLSEALKPHVTRAHWADYGEDMDKAALNVKVIVQNTALLQAVREVSEAQPLAQKMVTDAFEILCKRMASNHSAFKKLSTSSDLLSWSSSSARKLRVMLRHVSQALLRTTIPHWAEPFQAPHRNNVWVGPQETPWRLHQPMLRNQSAGRQNELDQIEQGSWHICDSVCSPGRSSCYGLGLGVLSCSRAAVHFRGFRNSGWRHDGTRHIDHRGGVFAHAIWWHMNASAVQAFGDATPGGGIEAPETQAEPDIIRASGMTVPGNYASMAYACAPL